MKFIRNADQSWSEAEYERLRAKGVPMLFDLRQEPWGDTHFAVRDPNGIGVDVVTYRAPE